MRFRERLFEGQLLVGQEGFLAAEGDLGGLGAVDHARSCLAAGCYAVAEFLNLSDVCIVPTGDEVLIALTADAMLAHNLYERVGRIGSDTQRAAGTNDFGLNMRCSIGMMATASTFGSAHSFFGS